MKSKIENKVISAENKMLYLVVSAVIIDWIISFNEIFLAFKYK